MRPPWWAAAKADVAAGSFVNMRSTPRAGTLWMDPYDEIVYSTMDLGRRLHWIYWLPGMTTADLAGRFEVKWVIDWGGDAWTYENGDWAADGANVGWSAPTSWENYNGGVIGSLGLAWWAGDDEAPPYNSNGSPWDEVDQADIDALRQVVFQYQTYARGMIRYRVTPDSEWTTDELQLSMVPEPGSTLLVGAVLAGAAALAYLRRRRR